MYYNECSQCGAYLDPGEHCDCEEERQRQTQRIMSMIRENKQTAEAWGISEGDLFKCNPYLQIRCVDGSHSMWVPSINDCLAEDWIIVK